MPHLYLVQMGHRRGDLRRVERAHRGIPQLKRARGVVAHGGGVVRGHDHGDPEVAVGAEQQRQEVPLCEGVEHGRGLVEQEQAGPHRERRRERERLALAAGELRRAGAEPRAHAQVRCRLGDAPAHLGLRHPQVLQPKGHLVPHALTDHLRVRVLEHVAHRARRLLRAEGAHVPAERPHGAEELPSGGDLWLGETQKR